jgi:RNA recognition motif-containing protein
LNIKINLLIEMRIYIGNLNYRLRTEELKNSFLPFGEVIGAKIVRDQETKRSKGFGFVEMANEEGLTAHAHSVSLRR